MSIEAAFIGTLGRDAEAKTSKTGKPYLRLNVAVGSGDATQWVGVLSFDSSVIELADKLLKGARVYVEGRLKLDSWTGQDGTTKHGLSVLASHVRPSEIGAAKPKRSNKSRSKARSSATQGVSFHDDALLF